MPISDCLPHIRQLKLQTLEDDMLHPVGRIVPYKGSLQVAIATEPSFTGYPALDIEAILRIAIKAATTADKQWTLCRELGELLEIAGLVQHGDESTGFGTGFVNVDDLDARLAHLRHPRLLVNVNDKPASESFTGIDRRFDLHQPPMDEDE